MTYYAIAAAPPRVPDIDIGQLAYIAIRVFMAAAAFLAVMAAFGAVESWWGLAAPLVALMVGLSAAAPCLAYAASVESDNMLALLFRFALLPMMLLSGVFFPVSQLPEWLQPLTYVVPLWHGVEVSRAVTLGIASPWPVPWHLAYLALWLVVGCFLARARFRQRLAV